MWGKNNTLNEQTLQQFLQKLLFTQYITPITNKKKGASCPHFFKYATNYLLGKLAGKLIVLFLTSIFIDFANGSLQ